MQNIPRIYLDENLTVGVSYPLPADTAHYLTRVMRADKCIVFSGGKEFMAEVRQKQSQKIIHYSLLIIHSTGRPDPSNGLTLAFAPIKMARLEELANMATQMGVARMIPVITERVIAHHINWERIKKIIVEGSEQSGRNSVPELTSPQKFPDFLRTHDSHGMPDSQGTGRNLFFADERFAHTGTDNVGARWTHPAQSLIAPGHGGNAPNDASEQRARCHAPLQTNRTILIGPEGGFSESEFAALDSAGAIPISLGKTILRTETAAVVALAHLARV